MKYVYLNFIAGTAGTFLARTLGLCDNVYSFSMLDHTFINDNVSRKFKNYSYKSMQDRSILDMVDNNWNEFEDTLINIRDDCSNIIETYNITDNSVVVLSDHPGNLLSEKNYAGNDDIVYDILINCDDSIELAFCNAVHKNSRIRLDDFDKYNNIKNLNDTLQVKFTNFFDEDSFIEEYTKICDFINIKHTAIYIEYVRKLHKEWITTVLTMDKIPKFKNNLQKIRRIAEQSRIIIGRNEREF